MNKRNFEIEDLSISFGNTKTHSYTAAAENVWKDLMDCNGHLLMEMVFEHYDDYALTYEASGCVLFQKAYYDKDFEAPVFISDHYTLYVQVPEIDEDSYLPYKGKIYKDVAHICLEDGGPYIDIENFRAFHKYFQKINVNPDFKVFEASVILVNQIKSDIIKMKSEERKNTSNND